MTHRRRLPPGPRRALAEFIRETAATVAACQGNYLAAARATASVWIMRRPIDLAEIAAVSAAAAFHDRVRHAVEAMDAPARRPVPPVRGRSHEDDDDQLGGGEIASSLEFARSMKERGCGYCGRCAACIDQVSR